MSKQLKLFVFILMLGCLMILQIVPASTQSGQAHSATQPIVVAQGIWDTAPTGGAVNQEVPPEATSDQPVNPDEMLVSISYSKADIANVLSFLSMASGVPIVLDADVKGTVTIISVKKVSLTTAYEVINSALRVRGYTMVGNLKDKLIRVVTLKKAIADKADVRSGNKVEDTGLSDHVITQVVPLLNASATKLKDELKPLVADDQANLLAISSTNMLVITDTEGNVRRLLQIINLLDKDNTDIVDVEIYQCKYASASALTASLEKIFTVTKPGASAMPMPGQPGGGRPPDPNNPNQPAIRADDGSLLSLKGELHLAADDRTNAIIISASRQRIDMVLKLVAKLDVDTTQVVRAKVFPLQYADAQIVASALSKIFIQPQGSGTGNNPFRFMMGGMPSTPTTQSTYAGLKENTVVADMRTNSVVVTATEQNMRDFETMIKQLDAPSKMSDISRAFPLKYASAQTLAQTLTSLFRGRGQSNFNFADLFSGSSQTSAGDPIATLRNITVVAEQKSNTILVTGPPQAFPMVEAIINNLDQRTAQVFIEVAIVDVTLNNDTKFGVEWNWTSDATVPGTTTPETSVGTDFGLSNNQLGLRYSVISDNLKVLLRALETRSDVKVYSTPSITTADNIEATISIGQDIPFVSSEENTTGGNIRRTVDFKNVSIALTVTPHVNGSTNLIGLDVRQTINELIGTEAELNAPITANREAKTTVMVNDGQTIVIGGIIKENKERVTNAVPLISRIPLLGELFKSRSNKTQKSELMVFLTPHILRDEQSVTAITTQEKNKLSDPPATVVPPQKQ